MNIFKVIASGKKSFFEEQMSAVLAWFLHPQMEHGLGYEFLSRFIHHLAKYHKELMEVEQKLKSKLRGDNTQVLGIELEESVSSDIGNAFIDVLISIDDWRIAVENKIYEKSASDDTQLNREYQGLISKYPDKRCALIFLVPSGEESGDTLSATAQQEYNAFKSSDLRKNEFLQIITWQKNSLDYPSICSIIESILKDESLGEIEPINEYTRHTLKAWKAFIKNGFAGYDYERMNEQSGLVYPRENVSTLIKKESGFVGVKGGIAGLIRMSGDELRAKSFQYSDEDMSHRNQWLPVIILKEIYEWKANGVVPNIPWGDNAALTLSYDLLYMIVAKCCPPQQIFIGIKGGEKALDAMPPETIKQKSWQIVSTNNAPNSQWISGITYRHILTKKGLWQTEYPEDRQGITVAKEILNKVIEKYSKEYDFAVYDSHPCSEQYDCISVVLNEEIHLLDFNLNGRLHLFRNVNNSVIQIEPYEFIEAVPDQAERIYSDICRYLFLERGA